MALENPLLDLINNEIPEGRQNLQQNHSNLELVAKYCEDNYFRVNILFYFLFITCLLLFLVFYFKRFIAYFDLIV